MESICVFAGSSPGRRSEYRTAVVALGEEIAAPCPHIVYGGAGGKVTGVIPRQLGDDEIAHGVSPSSA